MPSIITLKCSALNPNDAETYFIIGKVLYSANKFHGAAEAYMKAVELKPSFSQPYTSIGNIYGL